MRLNSARFQIGKNGLTEQFIESLKLGFKHRKQIRISVLKSFMRDREELEKIAGEVAERLGFNVSIRVIGFTIVLVKRK